ncbi:MAG: NAD(P)H-binding protein [Planctomycetota bacterium]|nr:NAD(P)H-binding protein [Planctomycetota bacterium]
MSTRRLAFVAGATGYTGSATVARLRALDVETVAHVRPDSQRLAEWRKRFEAIAARVDTTSWDATAMHATFRTLRPTHVFATLGTSLARSKGGSDSSVPDTYADVDFALTKMLIDASVAAGSVERFVYISAAGANAGTRNPYLKVRVEIERLIRASGLAFTVARPGFVSGSDREEARPLERISATASDVFFTLASSLGAAGFASRYRSISGTQLARGLVRAAFDANCKDRSLHAGDLRRPDVALS